MSTLERIAFFQGVRDEFPNQILAKELAQTENKAGIHEIAQNLFNKDKNIQSDCLKVLFEVGYINPELIADYAQDFLKLLKSRENRMVWGAMIALAVVAPINVDVLFNNLETIYSAMRNGTVITIDNGIRVLARIASKNEKYNDAIFPYLMNHLATCRPKEVGQHSESVFVAVNSKNKQVFLDVLKNREGSLNVAQLNRVRRIEKAAEKL